MAFSSKSLAGPGYIILNVIRAMNIIGLLCVIVASIVMLVKTFNISKFFFFDAASHVITAIVSMFLITSESSLFRGYFSRNWPLLSPSHGFVGLGTAMVVIGVNMLGHLNKEATSQESLGLPFWRIMIASGILMLILGCMNIISSFVFYDRTLRITARQVRAHGATAATLDTAPKALSVSTSSLPQTSFSSPIKSPLKAFSPTKTFRAARRSLLPSYRTSPPNAPYPVSDSGSPVKKDERRQSVGPRMPLNISAPLNVNPQFAHLLKPDLARHPSQRN